MLSALPGSGYIRGRAEIRTQDPLHPPSNFSDTGLLLFPRSLMRKLSRDQAEVRIIRILQKEKLWPERSHLPKARS